MIVAAAEASTAMSVMSWGCRVAYLYRRKVQAGEHPFLVREIAYDAA
jgi:hypothetical protein